MCFLCKDITFNRATERFRDGTVQAFIGDVKGYENVRVSESTLQFSNTNACYALYPVWILNTRWKDKSFRFAVNGQTGKIAGNLPISAGKSTMFWFIFFLIPVAICVALGFVFDALLILAAIGVITGAIIATSVLLGMRKVNKNVKFEYGAANYVRDNSFNINYRKSIFLYSKVTKTPRPQSSKK